MQYSVGCSHGIQERGSGDGPLDHHDGGRSADGDSRTKSALRRLSPGSVASGQCVKSCTTMTTLSKTTADVNTISHLVRISRRLAAVADAILNSTNADVLRRHSSRSMLCLTATMFTILVV